MHCVRLSNDGLVYVCDRANDRIQVFRKDGTFVKEFRVEPQTLQNGSVWDLVLSEDSAAALHLRRRRRQRTDRHARPRDRQDAHAAGAATAASPAQFKWVHNIAIDSKGNLYTAEVGFGRRAQKFKRM